MKLTTAPRSRLAAALAPPLFAACAAATLLSCGSGDEAEATRPNVILITLDTVRADFLTCYGATTGATPAIDELAKDGTLFERAVSSSGLTPASHATILTGKFQYNHGLRVLSAGSGYRLDSDQETLTKRLKGAGYRTAAVHSAFPVSAHFGFDEGFDHFDSFETEMTRRQGEDKTRWDVRKYQRQSDETTERTLAWFDENKSADAEDPYFLWLHYWDPHDFVKEPPQAEYDALLNGEPLSSVTDENTRKYAAELRWQDGHIGRLLAELRARGELDNTIIAVTADHGQGLADGMQLHRWGMHRMLYREQTHVPLIVSGPGVPSGKRVVDQVRTADVTPTLLDLAGIDPLPGPDVDGISLVSRFEGSGTGDLVAYGEQINGYDHNAAMRKFRPDATFLYMVSDGSWKLIYKPHMPQRSELFHIGIDPKETSNVIGDNPDQVERLLADLAARNPWVLDDFPEVGAGSSDASDALSGLGYSPVGLGGTADWWWTCPAHATIRLDERGRHEDGGCGRTLIPMGTWTDATPEEKPK